MNKIMDFVEKIIVLLCTLVICVVTAITVIATTNSIISVAGTIPIVICAGMIIMVCVNEFKEFFLKDNA